MDVGLCQIVISPVCDLKSKYTHKKMQYRTDAETENYGSSLQPHQMKSPSEIPSYMYETVSNTLEIPNHYQKLRYKHASLALIQ